MSLQTAEQWLSLIKHQVKVTNHNLECLLRQHKTMRTHFRTMRREARAQAKERALPETPTKQYSREVQRRVREMQVKLYAPKHKEAHGSKTHRKRKRGAPKNPKNLANRRSNSLDSGFSDKLTIKACPQPRHHPP